MAREGVTEKSEARRRGCGAAGSGQQNSRRPEGERLPRTSEETHGGQSGGRWTGQIARGLGPRPEVRLSREDSEQSLQSEQALLGCLADSRLLPRGQSRESGEEVTAVSGREAGLREAVRFCWIADDLDVKCEQGVTFGGSRTCRMDQLLTGAEATPQRPPRRWPMAELGLEAALSAGSSL